MQEHERVLSRSNAGDPNALHCNLGATVPECPRLFSGLLPTDYAGICRAARLKQFTRGECYISRATLLNASYCSPRVS